MWAKRSFVRQVPRNPKIDLISPQLATDINEGRVKQLFIFGGDPVNNAPRGLVETDVKQKVPLDWAELQKKAQILCGLVITRMRHLR